MIDYNTLNIGIRQLVRWLNEHGFETCDSGDGATHEHACDREYPYVVILSSKHRLIEETEELVRRLSLLGIAVVPQSLEGVGVSIQASYDPATETAVIDLMGLKDSMLPEALA